MATALASLWSLHKLKRVACRGGNSVQGVALLLHKSQDIGSAVFVTLSNSVCNQIFITRAIIYNRTLFISYYKTSLSSNFWKLKNTFKEWNDICTPYFRIMKFILKNREKDWLFRIFHKQIFDYEKFVKIICWKF